MYSRPYDGGEGGALLAGRVTGAARRRSAGTWLGLGLRVGVKLGLILGLGLGLILGLGLGLGLGLVWGLG